MVHSELSESVLAENIASGTKPPATMANLRISELSVGPGENICFHKLVRGRECHKLETFIFKNVAFVRFPYSNESLWGHGTLY